MVACIVGVNPNYLDSIPMVELSTMKLIYNMASPTSSFAMTTDGTYLYIGSFSDTDSTVYKIACNGLETVATSLSYGSQVMAIAYLDGYIYTESGDGIPIKIDTSDMTKVAEGPDYGSDISAITADDNYVFCGGNNPQDNVWKLAKSDLSFIANSSPHTGNVKVIVSDGTYIYTATDWWNKVSKDQISDMTEVDSTSVYGTTINALISDGTYLYCGGCYNLAQSTVAPIWKIDPSDMSVLASSTDMYIVQSLLYYDGYLYCCWGWNSYYLSKIDPSDLSVITTISVPCMKTLVYADVTFPTASLALAGTMLPYAKPGSPKRELSNRDIERTEDGKALIYDDPLYRIHFSYTWEPVTTEQVDDLRDAYLSAYNGTVMFVNEEGNTYLAYTNNWSCKYLHASIGTSIWSVSFNIIATSAGP
jgi:hypothetical protein